MSTELLKRHSSPPNRGSGLLQLLLRRLKPMSQDLEQELHDSQELQPPWTKLKFEVKYRTKCLIIYSKSLKICITWTELSITSECSIFK